MKTITQCEFNEIDFPHAERMARHLGYTQTAYTSSSDLIGLFCLPDRPSQHRGCIVKTAEFGLMFMQDMGDINLD